MNSQQGNNMYGFSPLFHYPQQYPPFWVWPSAFTMEEPIQSIKIQELEPIENEAFNSAIEPFRPQGPTSLMRESSRQKGFELSSFEIPKHKINKNAKSNTLKYFLLYLRQTRLSFPKVRKIIKARQLSITVEEFFDSIERFVKTKQFYCKPSAFRDLCHVKDVPQQFSIVLRILIRTFLKADLPFFLRKSPRLRRQTQLAYLYLSRKLAKDLFEARTIDY